MRRVLPVALLLLLSSPLHADCSAKSLPSQYTATITKPPCNAAAPCVQHAPVHFTLVGSCSPIPFYPGPCPGPYVVDNCDTLTWNFGDGTPTQTVYGSGAVDHVFPVAGNFRVNVDVTNGAGTSTIHGSAYICADPPAYVRFSQPVYTVSEHGGSVTVTLERSGNTARAFTLQYSTFPNGAEFVRNLEPLMMNVDFAAGETTKQVVHRVQDDSVFTGDSDHSVGVTSDGAAVMDAGPVTTSNIHVVEDEPGPELTIDDVTVPEGNGPHPVTFVLHLSKPASDRVYAWCVPHDGSAHAGVDFLLQGNTAIIEPGTTSGTCEVQVLGNTVVESDKTFTVSTDPILGPVTVKKGTASCTLTNDDVVVPVTPALWFPYPMMTMSVGTTERATLTATTAMNVSLASSDLSVVRVDPSITAPSAFQLTAVGYGRATITATSGSLSAKLVVDVALNPRRRSARH
ncbi:MAG TPA: Calx-beta domain-containing protein [Thermoanaerobaculia bacterium]|nr:Calx-beta domain-containing protein [Thermoanaerobaculia bacterium]